MPEANEIDIAIKNPIKPCTNFIMVKDCFKKVRHKIIMDILTHSEYENVIDQHFNKKDSINYNAPRHKLGLKMNIVVFFITNHESVFYTVFILRV